MLYLVGGVEQRDGVKRILFEPEPFIAKDPASAKTRAFLRWGVKEDESDDIEVYALHFKEWMKLDWATVCGEMRLRFVAV